MEYKLKKKKKKLNSENRLVAGTVGRVAKIGEGCQKVQISMEGKLVSGARAGSGGGPPSSPRESAAQAA